MSILQFYFSNPIRGCLKKKSYRYMDVSGAWIELMLQGDGKGMR
jgi:hypothetical protein